MHVVDRGDLGDDVHRHLVVVARRGRDVQAPEGVLGDVGRRLAQHVELAGVLHVVQLVADPVRIEPVGAQLELGGGPAAGVGFVELVDVHRPHTIADQGDRGCSVDRAVPVAAGGRDRGRAGPRPWRHAHHRVEAACRPHRPDGRRMAVDRPRPRRGPKPLRAVAGRDPGLSGLVLGTGTGPPPCPTPCDVVEHMRRASGRSRARGGRPPGPGAAPGGRRRSLSSAGCSCRSCSRAWSTVAGKLRWGQGGEWQDGEEFFGELLSTTWLVLQEWAGQDRPYAVLDLLSAIRCRVRRQLFRAKDQGGRGRPARSRRGRRAVRPLRDRPRGAGPDPRRPAPRRACAATRSRSSTPTTSWAIPSPSWPP